MNPSAQAMYAVDGPADAGAARRGAVACAEALGMDETERGRVALIATEAASNIAKHASRGEVLVRAVWPLGGRGVEILALDRGPGMADVARCRLDGYSTAGSAGTGLGAISRLSSQFDIHSTVGAGTAIVARVLARAQRGVQPVRTVDVGGVCLPLAGETVCGDAWHCVDLGERSLVIVADGLGHGPLAATAAQQAVQGLTAHADDSLEHLFARLHETLRGTRGAAVAVAELRPRERQVRFAGVGNIGALVSTPELQRRLVSLGGIVGGSMQRVKVFEYPWPRGARLIMHSDGLTSHFELQRYPGLTAHDPALVAAVLYRDHRRQRDDVTVVAVRDHEGEAGE